MMYNDDGRATVSIHAVAKVSLDPSQASHPNPIAGVARLVSEESARSWGLMSVGVFRRALVR
jgi:hypothetical protein